MAWKPSGTNLSRRSVLAGGAALAAGATLAGGSQPAQAATFNLIWNQWGPLSGWGLSTECNPGGGNFACGTSDTRIAEGSDGVSRYTEVTANPRGVVTYVNAIGNRRFVSTTPDNQPISLKTYQYVYALRLPRPTTKTSAPWIGEQIHQMIMFWDGSNTLWAANKRTLEAAIFWKLNPWDPNYGKIFAYTMSGGRLAAFDTGIVIPPDNNWHVFDVRADLRNRVYAGMAVDGHWHPLTNLPLAQIYHPDWGNELALILTAESENCYPGSTNPGVTQWTTQFKDPKLYRLD